MRVHLILLTCRSRSSIPDKIYKSDNTKTSNTRRNVHYFNARNITACLWNVRSLVNQLNSFQSYILSRDFHLIAITEPGLPTVFLMVRSCQVIMLYIGETEPLGEVECCLQLKIIYHPNNYLYLMTLNPLLLWFILAKPLLFVSYTYH